MARRVATGGGTAVHEAGHVVAALTLGMPVRYVSMRPRNRGAIAHVMHSRTAETPLMWERWMVVYAAGLVAEDVFFDRGAGRPRRQLVHGATHDLAQLMEHALYIERYGSRNAASLADAYSLACWAWKESVQLIYTNWLEVAAVARVLWCAPRAVHRAQLRAAMDYGEPASWCAAPSPSWDIPARRKDLAFWPNRYTNLYTALRRSA